MPRNRNRRLQPLLPQVGGTAVERWSSTEALGKCDQTRGSKMGVCKDSDEDEVAKARAAMKTTSGATGGGATYAKYGWKDEENAGAKNGAAEKRGESAYGFQNATLFNGMISPVNGVGAAEHGVGTGLDCDHGAATSTSRRASTTGTTVRSGACT